MDSCALPEIGSAKPSSSGTRPAEGSAALLQHALLAGLARALLTFLGELESGAQSIDDGALPQLVGLIQREQYLVAEPAIELGHLGGLHLIADFILRADFDPRAFELLAQRVNGDANGCRGGLGLARAVHRLNERLERGGSSAVVQEHAQNIRFVGRQMYKSTAKKNDITKIIEFEVLVVGLLDYFLSASHASHPSDGRAKVLRQKT